MCVNFAAELGGSFLIKLEQLQVAYRELLFGRSDHLAEIEASTCRRPFLAQKLLVGGILADQLLFGKLIPKGDNLELTVVADHHVTNVQIWQLDFRVVNLFEEDFVILDVVRR